MASCVHFYKLGIDSIVFKDPKGFISRSINQSLPVRITFSTIYLHKCVLYSITNSSI